MFIWAFREQRILQKRCLKAIISQYPCTNSNRKLELGKSMQINDIDDEDNVPESGNKLILNI